MIAAVRVVDYERLLDEGGFGQSPAFARVDADLRDAIDHVRWPPGASDFTIHPTAKGTFICRFLPSHSNRPAGRLREMG